MADQPVIAKSEDGRILTPQQLRKQECKMKINQICRQYNMQLVPIVQIIGSNMTTSVELAEIMAPVNPSGDVKAPEGGSDG
jgi:hypothetical protein